MINVDIYVPPMNHTYNFNLDEESPIQDLIDEIAELICKKEHSELGGDSKGFVLASLDQDICLNPGNCLREYSIKNGDQLLLV